MTAPAPPRDVPVEGYASLFWTRDLGGDVVAKGAFRESLATAPGPLKMLHQHDARAPVGVWDEVREDARGLYVKGRVLTQTPDGRLVGALVKAGALDGLSIGFRTRRARSAEGGRVRVLSDVDLWEVSLVTRGCGWRVNRKAPSPRPSGGGRARRRRGPRGVRRGA